MNNQSAAFADSDEHSNTAKATNCNHIVSVTLAAGALCVHCNSWNNICCILQILLNMAMSNAKYWQGINYILFTLNVFYYVDINPVANTVYWVITNGKSWKMVRTAIFFTFFTFILVRNKIIHERLPPSHTSSHTLRRSNDQETEGTKLVITRKYFQSWFKTTVPCRHNKAPYHTYHIHGTWAWVRDTVPWSLY